MSHDSSTIGRRDFFKTAGAGLAAAGALMTPREAAAAQVLAEKARLDRIAGCTWPIRQLFKTRQQPGRGNAPGGGAAAAGGRGTGAGGAGAGASGGAPGAPPQNIPGIPANRDRTTTAEMKQKYGEITMLDFPQWTKDTFPGVTRMDLFSGLFGDVTDDSMFITAAEGGGGGAGFNPTSA